MKKKEVMRSPTRSSSHRKEDKSKREFEAVIEPFFVSGWNSRDYGIDGVVEITSDLTEIGDVELESKCFLVQLKSTNKSTASKGFISFPVPRQKILYWYSYNLPVLFVVYEISLHKFNYIWIDENLISSLESKNPDWMNQSKISIKIPVENVFDENTLKKIKDYVYSWKIPARTALSPGKYFELKTKFYNQIQKLNVITNSFDFNSVNEDIKNIETEVDQSIYRIAVTGLSRVGKSSLLNGLLKKDVSPTGFFQTTGVPIQIIPGHKDEILVYFHNGTSEKLAFSKENIIQYASQDHNEDNKKKIRLLSVSIKNQSLERGVSLFDIPGLDDPDDDILEYTWQTVRKANAIIYVIDASPAEDGGYIFKNEYKKHITTFSQSQDKVFLVFNKVDKLSNDKLLLLKDRVILDLKKHNLFDKLGSKVFYLSMTKKGDSSNVDTIDSFNEALWSFMLNENKFGIFKLCTLNQELHKTTKEFIQMLNTRMLNNEQRLRLSSSIQVVKVKIKSLSNSYNERIVELKNHIFNFLIIRKIQILLHFEKNLKAVSIDNALPKNSDIRNYLIQNLYSTIEATNKEYVLQINRHKVFIEEWVEENLKQVREILNERGSSRYIEFKDLETFESPEIDLISAWGMGAIGAFVGLLIAPGLALIGGVIGFFGNLFTSAESRRAKQISKIVDKAREQYDKEFEKLMYAYFELIDESSQKIKTFTNRKLQLFFEDIESQLKKLDKPISETEMDLYKAAYNDIENYQFELNDFDLELKSYHLILYNKK